MKRRKAKMKTIVVLLSIMIIAKVINIVRTKFFIIHQIINDL